MKIIKRMIRNILNWANRESYPEDAPIGYTSSISISNSKSASMSSRVNSINDLNQGIHLTMFKATGGKVIQIHSYDPKTDRTQSSLYIIPDNEDLGEELSQIISREALSR